MASPEVLRVRPAPGVNVTDWRVPPRNGSRVIYIGRDIDGSEIVTEFHRSDGHLAIHALLRALRDGDLLPADAVTAAWSGVPLSPTQ